MKKYLFITMIVLYVYSCTPLQVAPTVTVEKGLLNSKNWNVAVLDLNYEYEDEGNVGITHYSSAGKDGGRLVAGILAAELAKLKTLNIIERSQITKLIDEQALQQSGMIDNTAAAEIGKIAGADAIIIGDLTDYIIWDNVSGSGSTISFSLRMIEVQSGKVIFNAAISRARAFVDTFANTQLTSKELIESINAQ